MSGEDLTAWKEDTVSCTLWCSNGFLDVRCSGC